MAAAYVILVALIAAAFFVNSYQVSSTGTNGSGTTFYEENPGPAIVLIALSTLCVLIATSSLLARVRARSSRYGTVGMVAAGVLGVAAILGLLSVGPFLVPLAALLIILALPMEEIAH